MATLRTRSALLAVLATTLCVSAAQAAGSCPAWMCGTNGVSLNGIQSNGQNLNGTEYQGVAVKSVRHTEDAAQPTVTIIVLPSGEVVDLR